MLVTLGHYFFTCFKSVYLFACWHVVFFSRHFEVGVLSFYLECLFSVFPFGEPKLSCGIKTGRQRLERLFSSHFLTFCTLTLQKANAVDATGTLWKESPLGTDATKLHMSSKFLPSFIGFICQITRIRPVSSIDLAAWHRWLVELLVLQWMLHDLWKRQLKESWKYVNTLYFCT